MWLCNSVINSLRGLQQTSELPRCSVLASLSPALKYTPAPDTNCQTRNHAKIDEGIRRVEQDWLSDHPIGDLFSH